MMAHCEGAACRPAPVERSGCAIRRWFPLIRCGTVRGEPGHPIVAHPKRLLATGVEWPRRGRRMREGVSEHDTPRPIPIDTGPADYPPWHHTVSTSVSRYVALERLKRIEQCGTSETWAGRNRHEAGEGCTHGHPGCLASARNIFPSVALYLVKERSRALCDLLGEYRAHSLEPICHTVVGNAGHYRVRKPHGRLGIISIRRRDPGNTHRHAPPRPSLGIAIRLHTAATDHPADTDRHSFYGPRQQPGHVAVDIA